MCGKRLIILTLGVGMFYMLGFSLKVMSEEPKESPIILDLLLNPPKEVAPKSVSADLPEPPVEKPQDILSNLNESSEWNKPEVEIFAPEVDIQGAGCAS